MTRLRDMSDEELREITSRHSTLPDSPVTTYREVPGWLYWEWVRRAKTTVTEEDKP